MFSEADFAARCRGDCVQRQRRCVILVRPGRIRRGEPGASPQECDCEASQPRKLSGDSVHQLFSIPDISLVEINAVPA